MLKTKIDGFSRCYQYAKIAIAAISRMLAENAELTIAQCIENLEKELEDD